MHFFIFPWMLQAHCPQLTASEAEFLPFSSANHTEVDMHRYFHAMSPGWHSHASCLCILFKKACQLQSNIIAELTTKLLNFMHKRLLTQNRFWRGYLKEDMISSQFVASQLPRWELRDVGWGPTTSGDRQGSIAPLPRSYTMLLALLTGHQVW